MDNKVPAPCLAAYRSDAVIVGGNTVRRDNPRLTTRREGGHTPVRVVMSRTLDLPQVRGGGRRG